MKHSVVVVMGGFSPEYEISIKSGNTVYQNLSRIRFDVYKVIIRKEKWVLITDDEKEFPIDKNDFSTTVNGGKITFDIVFNAIHGSPGEDGQLAAYLELIGIPQTSSGQFESGLTFNKAECKIFLKGLGVNVAESYHLEKCESYSEEEIIEFVGLPCFVKPSRSGSSFGISKVKNVEDLEKAIELAFEYDSQIIIESMIKGMEVACGVTSHTGHIKALACTDIVPKNEFFDYGSKYNGLSEEVTPARIGKETYSQIMEESKFIYKSLNLSGIARIDYIVTENGVSFLIEVNTIPGLSKGSILPHQLGYLGLSLGDFFNAIVENALKSKR